MLKESYWPADTSAPVLPTTVGGVLREAARRAPDKVALVEGVAEASDRRKWTYSCLLDEAERCARVLLAHFSPGERIAVWANNIPEWVILEFGAAFANVALVTVNPAYRPDELAYVLRQSRAAGVFAVPEYRGTPMIELVEDARPDLPALREVVSFGEWENFLRSDAQQATELPAVSPTDIAQVQYTSGTTGAPKGALLRHVGLTNNARFIAGRAEAGPDSVWLNVVPLFHTSGSAMHVLGAVQTTGTQVLVPGFDPGLVLELIESERVTTSGLVPTMLFALMEHPDLATRDLGSLRSVWSGGSAVPPGLVRKVEAKVVGARFSTVYGQTEASPIIAQTRLDDATDDKLGTVGQPLPQTEVRVADPATGEVVPPGRVGEIQTRGYLVMAGYFDMPEESAAAAGEDGWLRTGDLGSMDERGYLRIEGRIKEMIIRGGENIYPQEIEGVIAGHPAVGEVAVVGVPDERWGEQPAAFVRPTVGHSPSEEDLDAFVRERLAAYKAPRHWVLVEEFPRTPLGKIRKFVLRDGFVSSRGT